MGIYMQPKRLGGLSVRNVGIWNEMAIGKIAWHVHNLSETLWVRWVMAYIPRVLIG